MIRMVLCVLFDHIDRIYLNAMDLLKFIDRLHLTMVVFEAPKNIAFETEAFSDALYKNRSN